MLLTAQLNTNGRISRQVSCLGLRSCVQGLVLVLMILTCVTSYAQNRTPNVCAAEFLRAFGLAYESSSEGSQASVTEEDFEWITPPEFAEMQRVTDALLTRFPPDTHIYVGLGRSPAPIMAMLEAKGIRGTHSLPLSSFRSHPESRNWWGYTWTYAGYAGRLRDSLVDKLFRHFAHFLPNIAQLGQKNLVIMDYSESGLSLASAHSYLREYYKAQGYDGNILQVAFNNPNFQLVAPMPHGSVIGLQQPRLIHKFQEAIFDDFAPFGGFDIAKQETRELKPNPRYCELVEHFRRLLTASRLPGE